MLYSIFFSIVLESWFLNSISGSHQINSIDQEFFSGISEKREKIVGPSCHGSRIKWK